MSVANLIVTCALLVFGTVSGAGIDVSLRLQTRASHVDSPAEGVISAAPSAPAPASGTEPRPPIQLQTVAPGSARLALYPGVDHLLTVTDGLWSPPVHLRSADLPDQVTLTVSGTGILRMELVNGTGYPLDAWPEAVEARFQLVETPLEISPNKSFGTDCPVSTERTHGEERRTLVCELPEGVSNVRLEAPGFIPYYLWEIRMKPGGSLEPPAYALEKGASLIGTATREDGSPTTDAEVVLSPAVYDNMARANLGQKSKSLEYETHTDKRGFFQIRGIPQGSFDLRVRLADYGLGLTPEIQITEPVEHRLEEGVIIPYFPAAVVEVSPPADRMDKPWSLLLFDPNGVNRTAQTDSRGKGRFELLPAGRYVLMVQDSRGQRWISKQVHLGPRVPQVALRIEQIPVVGTLTLDGEPLEGDLYFGGRHGSESVEISSGPDGEFSGLLPREGEWKVEIQAEEPRIRTVERDLLVELDPGLGAAELAIDLPGNSIEGRAIDEDGHPVAGAQVIVQPAFRGSGITQVETREDGSFSLAGQRPGTYRLRALGWDRTSSATQTVEVIEDRATPPVELLLKKSHETGGRVVSPSGRGVPGAMVWPIREVGSPPPLDRVVLPARSGPDGEFQLGLGPDSPYSAVAILAPGFLLTLESLPPGGSNDGSMEIVLEPATSGGRLVFTDVQGSTPVPSGTVTIDGRWILPLFLLTKRALGGRHLSSDGPLVVPDLPLGRYQICTNSESSAPTCTAGFLSAGAALALHSREEHP